MKNTLRKLYSFLLPAACLFVLGSSSSMLAQNCPCTIWNASTVPPVVDSGDTQAGEFGLKFRTDVNGVITGIRYYKSAANTGVHIGTLWNSTGGIIATATFSAETATGWQQVTFSSPVSVTAGTTYIASVFMPAGHYAYSQGAFSSSGVDSPPLHALANGVDGANGVFAYGGSSTFPTLSFGASNYWVDVVFTDSGAAAGPTVASVSPANGVSAVVVSAPITATFNQPLDASTVNNSTFQLLDSSNNVVPASVTYNNVSLTATLQPSSPLAPQTNYTAVLKGGTGEPVIRAATGASLAGGYSWSFSTAGSTGNCPCTIWNSSIVPSVPDSGEAAAVELGVRFRSDVSGYITGIRFYKSAANTGTHIGNLWANDGTPMASATFSEESASGWQQVNFATPVQVTAGTTYVASYFTPSGHYAYTLNGIGATGVDNAPLHALGDNVDGRNGVFTYGPASAFPSSTFGSANYWVDVVFSTTLPTNPPTVAAVTPSNGASSVALTSTVTATFTGDIDPTSVNSANFQLLGPTGTAILASVSYNAATRTATLQPSAQLTAASTYMAVLRGVRNTSGTPMAANVTWSFSTNSGVNPPVVTAFAPRSTAVPVNTAVTATFNRAIDPTTLNANNFQLFGAGSTVVSGALSYNPATFTATLQPSAPLAFSTTYTVLLRAGGVKDTSGAALASNTTWTFTTVAAPPPQPTNCPCSIWTVANTPAVADSGESAGIELGVKFRSDVAGRIVGIRFYKSPLNGGAHIGNIWSAAGAPMASAQFTNESTSGWQQVMFNSPVLIDPGVTYIASYFAPQGHYAFDQNAFVSAGIDNAPLHFLRSGVDGGNGVFRYGSASAFPNQSFNSANYWIDVIYLPNNSTAPPSVLSALPSPNSTGVSVGAKINVAFNEPMDATTIVNSAFQIVDSESNPIPGTVSYIASSASLVFTPTTNFSPQTTYTATVKRTVKDAFGNLMAADYTWTFTTAPPPPNSGPGGPILVISSAQNPFSRYYGEILLNEGLNAFTVQDISTVNASTMAGYDVAILGDIRLTPAQVSMITAWVNAGGRLIAMRPDKQLAGLLGLTSTTNTLSEGYLAVNTATGPGVGIVSSTIQFHGTADIYSLSGATSVATLYSNATSSAGAPAVTRINVGAGQAAAFTYDLARSIVYTRQGNPAWSGQDRDQRFANDGRVETQIVAEDLFYGNATGDAQRDWVDLNKVAIPQADEQQRLLANLILQMNASRKPLPRFWYFPSGHKAVVVMTGDDHYLFNAWTAPRFDRYIEQSAPGCSVEDWTCIRATSYVFPNGTIPNYQQYVAQGFEIANHADNSPSCTTFTPTSLEDAITNQLNSMAQQFPGIAPSKTNRTHCVLWSDYDTKPKVLLNHGIRLDTSYYYWPPEWVLDRPGMFTGSGMPMRFADREGNTIDVYQATTQMPDEAHQTFPFTINALLDNAIGPQGYYGAFTTNMHMDIPGSADLSDDVVASAQARGVPVVSALQMLNWLDGRNSSAFTNMTWASNVLRFNVAAGTGARNLRAMLPANGGTGVLNRLTFNGSPVLVTTETIKGIQYRVFAANTGAYEATYGPPQPVAFLSPTTLAFGNQQTNTTSPARAVTLTNSGTANMTISNISVSGANASDFTRTHNCGSTLAVGASCTINVTFRPGSAGSRSANLSVTNNSAGSPHIVSMTGTGVAPAPAVTLSETAVAFGDQTLNTTSSVESVTLTNSGTATLSLSSITITGAHASNFTRTNTCNASITAGNSCTMNFTFRPTALGARTATVTISSNAPGSPHTVVLTGNGVPAAPSVSLSVTAIDFGNQVVNTTSSSRTVTVSNTGTATLNISSVGFTGANAAEFSRSGGSCGSTLGTGNSCTINVTFRPTAVAARSASLTITNNATGSPHTVALTGAGIAGFPVVNLSATSLTFTTQAVNTTSAARSVTVSNTGTAALAITSIAIGGTHAADFARTTTCGASLAAGSNCTISVTFRPTANGARTASLTITDNATGSPRTVSLAGTGTSVVVSPTSVSFGSQRINTTSSARTVTLTNAGTTTLTGISTSITGSNASNFTRTTTCGSSLAAGASCNISITFRPTSIGSRSATLQIASSDPSSPEEVSLTGSGSFF